MIYSENTNSESSVIFLKPNPVDKVLYIIYKDMAVADSYIEIFDIFGNKFNNLVIQSINNNELQIDVSNLINGLYFYRLSFNNNSFQGKFIIFR